MGPSSHIEAGREGGRWVGGWVVEEEKDSFSEEKGEGEEEEEGG